jgi:hypothetical protein
MGYVRLEKLEPNADTGEKLDLCTTSEKIKPASYYVEDIIEIMKHADFDRLEKRMATFWGERRPVWVGFRLNGTLIEDVIALKCPPYYYPQGAFPGVDVSDQPIPTDNFPVDDWDVV